MKTLSSYTDTAKSSMNENGLTLVQWLRAAHISVEVANNTHVRAWRENEDPSEYLVCKTQ